MQFKKNVPQLRVDKDSYLNMNSVILTFPSRWTKNEHIKHLGGINNPLSSLHLHCPLKMIWQYQLQK